MVRTYSASQKGKTHRALYRGRFWACEKHKTIKLDTVLAQIFEKFYKRFGKTPPAHRRAGKVADTAGYRDSVNWTGSKTSQHCYGKAADVAIDGVPAYELAKFAETLPEIGGIGLYLAKAGELGKEKHIHIDTRVKRAFGAGTARPQRPTPPATAGSPAFLPWGTAPPPSRTFSAG